MLAMRFIPILPLLIGAAMPAIGQEAPPPPMLCPAPADFAAWVRPFPLVAATRAGRGALPSMTMGQAAAVTLSPRQAVRPIVAPSHPGGLLSYAGLLKVTAPVAGTYRFALSSPAWLDLIEAGRSVPSAAHARGPECGPIRKLVDLPLAAGDHIVQLAAAPTPNVEIMAIRVR